MSVGLPVTFEDMQLPDLTEVDIDVVAKRATIPNETCHAEPFDVTFEEMRAAIVLANDIGQLYKQGGSLLTGEVAGEVTG
jgi:glycerol dehydrogenase